MTHHIPRTGSLRESRLLGFDAPPEPTGVHAPGEHPRAYGDVARMGYGRVRAVRGHGYYRSPYAGPGYRPTYAPHVGPIATGYANTYGYRPAYGPSYGYSPAPYAMAGSPGPGRYVSPGIYRIGPDPVSYSPYSGGAYGSSYGSGGNAYGATYRPSYNEARAMDHATRVARDGGAVWVNGERVRYVGPGAGGYRPSGSGGVDYASRRGTRAPDTVVRRTPDQIVDQDVGRPNWQPLINHADPNIQRMARNVKRMYDRYDASYRGYDFSPEQQYQASTIASYWRELQTALGQAQALSGSNSSLGSTTVLQRVTVPVIAGRGDFAAQFTIGGTDRFGNPATILYQPNTARQSWDSTGIDFVRERGIRIRREAGFNGGTRAVTIEFTQPGTYTVNGRTYVVTADMVAGDGLGDIGPGPRRERPDSGLGVAAPRVRELVRQLDRAVLEPIEPVTTGDASTHRVGFTPKIRRLESQLTSIMQDIHTNHRVNFGLALEDLNRQLQASTPYVAVAPVEGVNVRVSLNLRPDATVLSAYRLDGPRRLAFEAMRNIEAALRAAPTAAGDINDLPSVLLLNGMLDRFADYGYTTYAGAARVINGEIARLPVPPTARVGLVDRTLSLALPTLAEPRPRVRFDDVTPEPL